MSAQIFVKKRNGTQEKFNIEIRAPVILPDCGHTFCEYCVADLLSETERTCPTCSSQIVTTDTGKFIKN